MKIIMGGFYHESNTFNPFLSKKEEFISAEGEELLEYFPGAVKEFRNVKAEIVPSIFAGKMCSGVIEEESFIYFTNKILETIKNEKNIDGIWLQLHGAIYVENIGSGEHYILKEVRKIIGYDIPVAVAFDPHANLSPDITKYANIIRAYHTAPHTDQDDTYKETAKALIDVINRGEKVTPAFVRLPMLLCGDKALTRMEPLKSVINRLKELEKTKEIILASFMISFHSGNTENTYPSVIIVPREEKYYSKAMEIAQEIAEYIFSKRFEFKFEADLVSLEEAVDIACASQKSPVCISDSGDNTTAGAAGMNTGFLKRFLEKKHLTEKKVLISTIYDEKAYKELVKYNEGQKVNVMVGTSVDKYSQPVRVNGILKSKGSTILYNPIRKDTKPIAGIVTVSVGNVDVSITEIPDSFTDDEQCLSANIDPDIYDIIVVKQAYQFPDISKRANLQNLALTPGHTYQDLPAIQHKYTKLPWTIFPFQEK